MLKTLILATALAAGTLAVAQAQTLKPVEASMIDLGDTHGSAYYVASANGYHVVATLETGNNTPLRFAADLAKGQSASLSIPGTLGETPMEITFVRTADTLEVRKSAVPFDAVTASTK